MSKLQLTPSIKHLTPSATLAINNQVTSKRDKQEDIVHFGFGQSPFKVPMPLVDALVKSADNKQYLPGEGLERLRTAINSYYHDYYDYPFTQNDVLVFPGSKDALFHLLFLLDGPLLLPKPSWVSYAPQARLLNKEICLIETTYEQHYEPSPDKILEICKKYDKHQQKILLLNSPNNPTGLCISDETLKEIAAISRQHNIIILSDEIYAGVYFNDQTHASMTYHAPDRTIVTGGLSKLFSAGGYRFGFCLIPDNMSSLKQALTTMISETFSCVASPIQYAALTAYQHFDEIKPYLDNCTAIHQLVGFYLHEQFQNMEFLCHKPQGAFYLFPSFIKHKNTLEKIGIKTDKALCHHLLNHYNLALLPGSDFLMPEEALTIRVATVDYDGNEALKANHIDAPCFKHIHQGVKILSDFLKNI